MHCHSEVRSAEESVLRRLSDPTGRASRSPALRRLAKFLRLAPLAPAREIVHCEL